MRSDPGLVWQFRHVAIEGASAGFVVVVVDCVDQVGMSGNGSIEVVTVHAVPKKEEQISASISGCVRSAQAAIFEIVGAVMDGTRIGERSGRCTHCVAAKATRIPQQLNTVSPFGGHAMVLSLRSIPPSSDVAKRVTGCSPFTQM